MRIVQEQGDGQRVDNYLLKLLKGVPQSRIYKAIRSGEVRVNSSRVKVSHKLKEGDRIRIPPLRMGIDKAVVIPPKLLKSLPVLYEDDDLLIIDKPCGLAVHSGTDIAFGVIEALRELRVDLSYIELAHRLDRETSGCLMLAKTRPSLLALQQQLNQPNLMEKSYLVLVRGRLEADGRIIDIPIARQDVAGSTRMTIDFKGKRAKSAVSTITCFQQSTLIKVILYTGRTHQVRVHCAAIGYPVAGDNTYGDKEFNQAMRKTGLGRLFLHASELTLAHPMRQERLKIKSELPRQLVKVIENQI